MKEYRLVSIPTGSWKWQNRYALKSYSPRLLKNGKLAWQLDETLNKFIKPTWRTKQSWVYEFLNKNFEKDVFGSLHNKVICDKL